MTYTVAILKVSRAAFEEIWKKLKAAGYEDQFYDDMDGHPAIDMHGIALMVEGEADGPSVEGR